MYFILYTPYQMKTTSTFDPTKLNATVATVQDIEAKAKNAESTITGLSETAKKALSDSLKNPENYEGYLPAKEEMEAILSTLDTLSPEAKALVIERCTTLSLNKTVDESMTAIEKERKDKCYQSLKDHNIDTPENRAKIDAVKFGPNYVEIWGIKFSAEKLQPQNVVWEDKNEYGVYPSDTKGLRKAEYNGEDEYYYDLDAYIAECKKQNKTPLTRDDLEQAMKSLPGVFEENFRHNWWNILPLLLWISTSGGVDPLGKPMNRKDEYGGPAGFLGSSSSLLDRGSHWWVFHWDATHGQTLGATENFAKPSLFRI